MATEACVDEAARLADVRALHLLDTPPDRRFDRIVRLASSVFGVPIAYVALIDRDRQWFKARVGLEASETPRETSFCTQTILRDRPLIIPDAEADPSFRDHPMVVGEPWLRFYAGHPLRGPGGRNVGTLCLADRRPRAFGERDREVFSHLAELAEHELNLFDVIGAQRTVLEVRRRLQAELGQAEAYVRSLLPERFGEGCVIRTDYHLLTSSQLGGDLFGYHWLDDNRLALYLLDVTGHGIAASLLAASVNAALSPAGLLDEASRDDPAAVLAALNRAFPMEKTGNRFFTIWYGVYDRRDRSLRYAAGGHPPAIAFHEESVPVLLGEPGYMIGVTHDARYEARQQTMPPGSRLYLFSDGAFEVRDAENRTLGLDGLVDLLTRAHRSEQATLAHVLQELRRHQEGEDFADDLSLLEVEFA